MSNEIMSNPKYTTLPSEVADDDALAQLAMDVRFSWQGAADTLWERLNPELWKSTHNPWVVLQIVSGARLAQITSGQAFKEKLDRLTETRHAEAESPRWFHRACPNAPLSAIAYFSMEFMLSEALPIYSRGLGNVAGDQLKAASDLGVPVIGVGLLYDQGYFRQEIDRNGAQRALYPF
jgi:starch phosphorylase